MRAIALGWLMTALVAACGGGGGGGLADIGAGDVIGGDVVAADTGISVDAVSPGEFVLGTNVVGADDPASFSALSEGGALEVQIGFQGLWMVVLAFKTRDMFAGELFLSAELTVDGASQGTLSLAQQKPTAGPGGWSYYYNFFLVVDDPGVGGQPGQIHFVAHDDHGHEHAVALGVALTGGE